MRRSGVTIFHKLSSLLKSTNKAPGSGCLRWCHDCMGMSSFQRTESMTRKKFLVLGHPRSGTGFMSQLFFRFGLDVGHEMMCQDGISSWMFAVEENQVYTDESLNRKDFDFEHVIMVIRNPMDIICSTYWTENVGPSLQFRQKYIDMDGLNLVERAVKSVLGWYKIIEEQKPAVTIYVDKDPERTLCDFLNAVEGRHFEMPPGATGVVNAREHPSLPYEVVAQHCQPELLREMQDFCQFHQYLI